MLIYVPENSFSHNPRYGLINTEVTGTDVQRIWVEKQLYICRRYPFVVAKTPALRLIPMWPANCSYTVTIVIVIM